MEGGLLMPLLQVRGLQLARGARTILAGVDLAVSRGEIVALMGLSGSGKTTILRSIAALERFDAGEIAVDDVTLRAKTDPRASRRALHQKVGMVFQFHYLFEHLSALDNVCLAPVHVQQQTRAAAEARAQSLLAHLGVGHRSTAFPRELSGGEAQRVAIARALAVDPPLLLLDEPTASLDPARCQELGETLRTLAAEGRTLTMTSHDDEFVAAYATRVVILAEGRVVEAGKPTDVLRNPQHAATRALLTR
ncbi:MAG TPA: ATP-binding cassette domain-containing protein [Vicinamibacterales bacterium]|nr:ATP-binding cassette domain-containing protein [Vicinamibacterales bacterium]